MNLKLCVGGENSLKFEYYCDMNIVKQYFEFHINQASESYDPLEQSHTEKYKEKK